MKPAVKYLCLLILVMASLFAAAQNNTQTASQLAFKYYNAKEYRPASSLFYNLFKATKSKTYFRFYIECMLKIGDYKDAESLTKKQIRKHKHDKTFIITLGYIYKNAQQFDKAKEQFDKALEKMAPADGDIISVADAFVSKREYIYAVKAYLKGRELLKNKHLYHLRLANIYLYQRDYQKMVPECLNALVINPKQLTSVKNQMQNAFVLDIDYSLDKILKRQLFQKLLDYPKNIAFKELMQWYYMQKKQFDEAFIQAKSIDLLQKENGIRLILLARAATKNKDYKTAIKSLQAVIDKGKESAYYLKAEEGLLHTRYIQLKESTNVTPQQWADLSNSYSNFLSGKQNKLLFVNTIVELAHLKSRCLNQSESAIADLESLLKNRRLNRNQEAMVKMELADIKLFIAEKWDAILLYSQIEKANKNNALGFEAKFKKAKVSYYLGEIKWANAQLAAIKGSTSKLIANDAIALSQFITENTSLDTSYTAMQQFARADFLYYQQHTKQALSTLDSLLQQFPSSELVDDVYFLKYKIYKQTDVEKAQTYLDQIIDSYPQGVFTPKAIYLKALFLENRQREKAIALLKKILTDYSDSIYVVDAREKLNQLKQK